MMMYLSINSEGRVNGYGDDPSVFERAIPAPEGFDPSRHLATARMVGATLVLDGPPPTVTARQGRLALLSVGLLDDIEAAIEQMPREVQITWEYATEFTRDWPLLTAAATEIGLTEEQIDNLFMHAATL